jgi:hypothetical protein
MNTKEVTMQQLRNEYKETSVWARRLDVFWGWVYAIYFLIFMIPESFWVGRGVELVGVDMYDFVAVMVKKSSFPLSVYIFWLVAPFFMIIASVVCVARLWTSYEFERFLLRTNDGKQMFKLCFLGFSICIGAVPLLSYWGEGTILYKTLQPFHNKLPFFLIFGGCVTAGIPAVFSLTVTEFRARLTHRRGK